PVQGWQCRTAPVRIQRLGRYPQYRGAPRGGESAEPRARVRGDGERIGKRLPLRWSAQDRQQGGPRCRSVFRKPSPLTMSRLFRSRRPNNLPWESGLMPVFVGIDAFFESRAQLG